MHQEAFLFHKSENDITKEKVKIKKKNPLKVELKSFVDCVRNNKKPIVSGQEGRQALRVALDILDKIHNNNGPVQLIDKFNHV